MAARAARPPAIDGDLGDAVWEATPWTEQFVDMEAAARPGQAAVILNQKIYGLFNVRCSTKRKKADQSPYESIESGLATCSDLAVLLIDARRAVGGDGQRAAARVEVKEVGGEGRFEIKTNDERFDMNDHRTVVVRGDGAYDVVGEHGGQTVRSRVERPAECR